MNLRLEGDARRRRHRLFGLTLASDYDFATPLTPGRGAADLTFTCSSAAPIAVRRGELVYDSPLKDGSGDSLASLYRTPAGEILRFGEALDYHLGDNRVHCHLRRKEDRHLVEIRLLGSVLAYWLERRGVCALHASAVVVDDRAVAFMASHRGGKSGLAAAMMSAGHPLLTDDLLPIERRGGGLAALSGYPQMRLWPDQLDHFVRDWERLGRIHPELDKRRLPVGPEGFGAFHAAAVPPGVIYLPERRPAVKGSSQVRLTPLSAREALIELVRCSFAPYLVEAVGLQARRLELLARLAKRVPMRRLSYPFGPGALDAVRRTLAADLQALRGSPGPAAIDQKPD